MDQTNKTPKASLKDRINQLGGVSQEDILEFTRHFAVMLKAGLTVRETIDFLEENTKNPVLKTRLKKVIQHVENGESLSSALSRYPKLFSEVYINIVRIGENVGGLDDAMEGLADQLENSMIFKKKVKGALIYPKVVMLTMVVFLIVLTVFVMPRLMSVFESMDFPIPKATLVIMGLSEFLKSHYLWVILGAVGAYFAFKKITKQPAVRSMLDALSIKLPIFGNIITNYNTAQVAQYFSTTFLSGVTVVKALQITKNVIQNTVFKNELSAMEERINNGSELSQSFQKNSKFPSMFTKMIRVGERTGKLPEVVKYVSDYYQKVMDSQIKNLTSTVEPLIIAMIGLVIAGLVLTVIRPIYELISQVAA